MARQVSGPAPTRVRSGMPGRQQLQLRPRPGARLQAAKGGVQAADLAAHVLKQVEELGCGWRRAERRLERVFRGAAWGGAEAGEAVALRGWPAAGAARSVDTEHAAHARKRHARS